MTLNNIVLSSRIGLLGTPLCLHLAWPRQCCRSSSCCILSDPPSPNLPFLSVVKVACSKAKSNIVQPVFVYPAHSSVGHLPEDMLYFVTFFIPIWKGADLGYLKWCVVFFFLVLDWFAEQLLNGVLRRWLLQPASLWGAHSQEGWHNHDNGKDGIEGQCVWGEVGAEIPSDVLMCLRPPAFHLFPLFSPAFFSTNSYRSLMFSSGLLNGFSWSVQYLFVGCANTGKVQAPFLYIRRRVVFFFFLRRRRSGWRVEDVYSDCPIVAAIHLVMSLGVVRLVN